MTRNWLASAFLLLLISGMQDLFVKAGYNSNCPDFSRALVDGCTLSKDCSSITCKLKFAKKNVNLQVKINKCESPVTITTSMKVPDLNIDWSHEYSSGDIVKVPRFKFTPLGGLFSVGVYIQVVMANNGKQLNMTVNLLGGAEIGGRAIYPVKVKVLGGKISMARFECGIIRWWNESSDFVKAVVIIAILIFLILLIVCFYRYCYKKRPTTIARIRPPTIARVRPPTIARVGKAVSAVTPQEGIVTIDTENVLGEQNYSSCLPSCFENLNPNRAIGNVRHGITNMWEAFTSCLPCCNPMHSESPAAIARVKHATIARVGMAASAVTPQEDIVTIDTENVPGEQNYSSCLPSCFENLNPNRAIGNVWRGITNMWDAFTSCLPCRNPMHSESQDSSSD